MYIVWTILSISWTSNLNKQFEAIINYEKMYNNTSLVYSITAVRREFSNNTKVSDESRSNVVKLVCSDDIVFLSCDRMKVISNNRKIDNDSNLIQKEIFWKKGEQGYSAEFLKDSSVKVITWNGEERLRKVLLRQSSVSPADGVWLSWESLPGKISDLINKNPESGFENETQIVRFGEYGKLTVRFANIANRYILTGVDIEKDDKNILNYELEKKVVDIKRGESQLEKYTFNQDLQYSKDGVSVTGATIKTVYGYSDKTRVETDFRIDFQSIKQFHTGEAEQQEIYIKRRSIPNGTTVSPLEEELLPIKLIWKDGIIVKKIDEAPLEYIEKLEFKSNNTRFTYIILTCVLLIAGGIAAYLVKRKYKNG